MDRLGAAGEAVQPLFITVDPEKDTPAQLKAHVGLFHPRMIGLTGSAKQIRKVANDFKVYFAPKRTDPRIDHTGFTFLERFPFFVNRGDSQRGANKILWSSRIGERAPSVGGRLSLHADTGLIGVFLQSRGLRPISTDMDPECLQGLRRARSADNWKSNRSCN